MFHFRRGFSTWQNLLDYGIAITDDEENALIEAVFQNNTDFIKVFLEQGGDADITIQYEFDANPVHGFGGSMSDVPLKAMAYELGHVEILELLGEPVWVVGAEFVINVVFVSFGFKHGALSDADRVFNVRNMDNPTISEYLSMNGLNKELQKSLWDVSKAAMLFERIYEELRESVISVEGREYDEFRIEDGALVLDITIGVGCHAGKHRSVATVERLACSFWGSENVTVYTETRHRDIYKTKVTNKGNHDRKNARKKKINF